VLRDILAISGSGGSDHSRRKPADQNWEAKTSGVIKNAIPVRAGAIRRAAGESADSLQHRQLSMTGAWPFRFFNRTRGGR
jgi:hypothetical protein